MALILQVLLPILPPRYHLTINPQAYAIKPGSFVDVIELLLPELRKRGLFWDDYFVEGGTYRENIRSERGAHPSRDHPAAKYQWRAGVTATDAVIPAEPETSESVVEANDAKPSEVKPKEEKSNGTKANDAARKRAAALPQENDRVKRRSTRSSR